MRLTSLSSLGVVAWTMCTVVHHCSAVPVLLQRRSGAENSTGGGQGQAPRLASAGWMCAPTVLASMTSCDPVERAKTAANGAIFLGTAALRDCSKGNTIAAMESAGAAALCGCASLFHSNHPGASDALHQKLCRHHHDQAPQAPRNAEHAHNN